MSCVKAPAVEDPVSCHLRETAQATRHDSFPLGRAASVLRQGGVIGHATEGVWGLACLASNEIALQRLLQLKGRRADRGLIVIAGDAAAFSAELSGLPMLERIRQSWPGAVTWLVPDHSYSSLVRGRHSTVALRVPGHAQTRALCELAGEPLVSTSANPQGRAAARNALQVRHYFGRNLDFLLPGQTAGRAGPSKIRDAITGAVVRI